MKADTHMATKVGGEVTASEAGLVSCSRQRDRITEVLAHERLEPLQAIVVVEGPRPPSRGRKRTAFQSCLDSRQHLGTLPSSPRLRPENRESIENSQAARPGCELVWLESSDHEFGVVGWGPFAVHPGELTNTLSDITLIFIMTGQVPGQ